MITSQQIKARLAALEKHTGAERPTFTIPPAEYERCLATAAETLAEMAGIELPGGMTSAQRAQQGRTWLEEIVKGSPATA